MANKWLEFKVNQAYMLNPKSYLQVERTAKKTKPLRPVEFRNAGR